jgi:pSer/pThr/pTyr-binding forkhead associated (FHA) protein
MEEHWPGDVAVAAPSLGDTIEAAPAPSAGDEPPEWLDEARAGLADAGDYLVFDDGDEIRAVAIADGWTRIGRSLSADVRIDDPTVSRRHALVHRDGDVVRVLDDRSLNGVLHNGRRVDLERIEDGDAIVVGRFELRFLRLARDRQSAFA